MSYMEITLSCLTNKVTVYTATYFRGVTISQGLNRIIEFIALIYSVRNYKEL
jgi:hypothetical protein